MVWFFCRHKSADDVIDVECWYVIVTVVLDRKNDKSCDTGLFELIYRQPPITDPPQLETNLCVEGRKVIPWVRCRPTALLIGLFRCQHFNHCICTGYVSRFCTEQRSSVTVLLLSWLCLELVWHSTVRNIYVINFCCCDICIVFWHIFLGLFNKLYVFLLQVEQTYYIEVCFMVACHRYVFQDSSFKVEGCNVRDQRSWC